MSPAASKADHCPDCFQPPRPEPVCRHCGFDWRTYQDSADYLPPFTVLAAGRYVIGRVLGRPGGFGVVYAGWHSDLHSHVAIKEFFPGGLGVASRARDGRSVTARGGREGLFERWRQRFLQEARLLARFRGAAHIVTVYDVFQANGTAYLVMERLTGQSLSDYLGGLLPGPNGEAVTGARLAPAQAGIVLDGLLAALESLHAVQVYHRDLTPNNVFLVERDPARVKLLDFGLASSGEDPRRGLTSVGVGTPGFAAPEQAVAGGPIGPATDLYALGATLYTALTGVAPPGAELRKSGLPLPKVGERLPGLPAPLANLIDACLALEPQRRPQSVAEVRSRLSYQTLSPSAAAVAGPDLGGVETLLPGAAAEPIPGGPAAVPMPTAGSEPARAAAPSRAGRGMRFGRIILGGLLVAALGYFGVGFLQDRPAGEPRPRAAARVERPEAAPPAAEAPAPMEPPAPGQDPAGRDERVFRDALRDGGEGPVMVVVPAGSFAMSDPQDPARLRRWIEFTQPFALSRYEVMVEEYLRCVQAGVCHPPHWAEGDAGEYYKKLGDALTDGRHPIVGVSWYDALAYARWLARQTGQPYRLPTEAEWEYAARSAAKEDDSIPGQANCEGCGSAWDNRRPAPVGSFAANSFGLHDTAGNVAEWTCSPWAERLVGQEQVCAAPADTSRRAIRGGGWDSGLEAVRATTRSSAYPPDYRSNNLGFRLARDL